MATSHKQRKVTDEEIIDQFKSSPDPFVTAAELSERLPISRQRINDRLRKLLDEGFVSRKQCGSGMGWWLSDYPND